MAQRSEEAKHASQLEDEHLLRIAKGLWVLDKQSELLRQAWGKDTEDLLSISEAVHYELHQRGYSRQTVLTIIQDILSRVKGGIAH